MNFIHAKKVKSEVWPAWRMDHNCLESCPPLWCQPLMAIPCHCWNWLFSLMVGILPSKTTPQTLAGLKTVAATAVLRWWETGNTAIRRALFPMVITRFFLWSVIARGTIPTETPKMVAWQETLWPCMTMSAKAVGVLVSNCSFWVLFLKRVIA